MKFTKGKFGEATMYDARKDPEGYKKCLYRLACDVGTHIDTPSHWYEGARAIHQLTLDELTAPGAVIDVSKKCEKNSDYVMTIDDVK